MDVPKGMYQPARVGRGMGRHRSTVGLDPSGAGHRGVHIPTEGEDADDCLGSDGSDGDPSGKETPSQTRPGTSAGKQRLGGMVGGKLEDVPKPGVASSSSSSSSMRLAEPEAMSGSSPAA